MYEHLNEHVGARCADMWAEHAAFDDVAIWLTGQAAQPASVELEHVPELGQSAQGCVLHACDCHATGRGNVAGIKAGNLKGNELVLSVGQLVS